MGTCGQEKLYSASKCYLKHVDCNVYACFVNYYQEQFDTLRHDKLCCEKYILRIISIVCWNQHHPYELNETILRIFFDKRAVGTADIYDIYEYPERVTCTMLHLTFKQEKAAVKTRHVESRVKPLYMARVLIT